MVSFPFNSHLHYFFPATFVCFSLLNIFIFFDIFIATYAADSEEISYNTHCSSFIPQATTTHKHALVEFPYTQSGTGYRTGCNKSCDVSLHYSLFPSGPILETTISGVYRVEAQLHYQLPYVSTLPSPNSSGRKSRFFDHHRRHLRSSWIFEFTGFWSEPAGKLCMVGRAPWQSDKGESIELEGVLKLDIPPKNSTIFTSLTKGSLHSVSDSSDPRYFEPVKIVGFRSYITSYDFKVESECVGGNEIDGSQSISMEKGSFCSVFWGQHYHVDLQYASDCEDRQNCSPLDRDIAYLPQSLSLDVFQCFEENEKLRILLKFLNTSRSYGKFDTRTALLGEGSWDKERNQLCIVACKILHPIDSPWDAYVDDCSTRLSLRFPAIWTIKNNRKMIGEIWTNKTASDPGYFRSIGFSKIASVRQFSSINSPKPKYVYSQVALVQHSCYANEPSKNGNRYPDASSNDMRFDFFAEQSNEIIARGHAAPISVGDIIYNSNTFMRATLNENTDMDYSDISKPITIISYKISIHRIELNDEISSLNASVHPSGYIDITAEGFYNPQTGVICMAGCRELKSHIVSHDCEIVLTIELPPLHSRGKSFGEGFIYTKRENTDPLYFKGFNITLASYNTLQAMRALRRINLQIIMALASSTFSVIFLASQIFYVKKHPEKLPFVSILMLGILTLGHLIPLVSNFEAHILKNLDQENVILQAKGWLEVKDLSVRVVTLVAVFLNIRLLQLALTQRLRDENGYNFWKSELNAVYVSFPVYLIGAMINLFGNMYIVSPFRKPPSSFLKYFSSYTGLIHDGYLLPQIIFNVFQNSRESALSPVFYMGTTLVRLLPHVYDLYRIHFNYGERQEFGGSIYVYQSHTADSYSKAWDVIIPCVFVLLAVIIFLQQRSGGDIIVPKKYKKSLRRHLIKLERYRED